MTYKIITDDTGEEVHWSAIRPATDPTMRNLREDPITITDDLILEEDILSPADDILNKDKIGAEEDIQGMHFRKPNDEETFSFSTRLISSSDNENNGTKTNFEEQATKACALTEITWSSS